LGGTGLLPSLQSFPRQFEPTVATLSTDELS
jgi:hypothetical protein